MGRKRIIEAAGPSGPIELLYNPYQQEFLRALELRLADGRHAFSRLALFAGRRGGKTLIGGLAVVKQAVARSKQTIWVCTGSYPKLHDYVIPAVNQYLPPSFLKKPFSETNKEWSLINDTIIQARSLDDINRARGPGLDVAWIDEARDVAERAWETMIPALTDKLGVAIVTTTPSGFDWCYDTFWAPALEGEPGYWACKYRTSENPLFQQPGYKEELEANRRRMDPLFFQQEFEAEFVSFTGAIYGDVLANNLVETPAQLKLLIPEWPNVSPARPVVVGIDPGADHPFGAVACVGTEKGLVVIGEYLARDSAAMKHAQGLFAMLHACRLPAAHSWAIDRSQKQMAIELAQHGIYTSAAENDVVAGIQRVKSWLYSGRLYIYRPNCPKLVQQMFSYRWAENTDSHGQAKRESVVKVNDDLPDALRYAMMTWPETPYPEAPLPLRKLDEIPPEHRWAMEREQRIEHPELFEDEDADLDEAPGLLAGDESGPGGNFWD